MMRVSWVSVCLVCALITFAGGGAFAATRAASASPSDVIMPFDAMKWEDGPVKGTHVVKLKGDWMKGGPYEALVKFDAGQSNPLHHHSQDLKIVVISGTFLHTPKGGTENRLGPGSYLVQRAGKEHLSGCTADADCIFYMTARDKFDLIPAKGAAPVTK